MTSKFNTNIARLWQVTPINRPSMFFTDHDKSIEYAGNLFRADVSFEASAVQSTINGGQANISIVVELAEGSITALDIERGVFDSAAVNLTVVDYNAPDVRNRLALVGRVSRATVINPNVASLEIVGSNPKLFAHLNDEYTPYCRAEFGDSRCTVDLEQYGVNFTTTAVIGPIQFTSEDLTGVPHQRFNQGHVLWLSGANRGRASEVVQSLNNGAITLLIKPPYLMATGDRGTIYQGCPKTLAACGGYNNRPNFRGEPMVPTDKGLKPVGGAF